MDRLRFDDPIFCSLLKRFENAIRSDPEAALQVAEEVLDLAEQRQGADLWRYGWRGFALAAQAHRRLSNFRESAACIENAGSLIWKARPSTVGKRGKELAWSLVVLRLAFLAQDSGDQEFAEFCLNEQRGFYQEHEVPFLGRNRIDQAIILEVYRAEWREVADVAEEGLASMLMEADLNASYRKTGLALRLNAQCDSPAVAPGRLLQDLDELRQLQTDSGPFLEASFEWISGRVLLAAGQPERGEASLEKAIKIFADHQQPIRAARAALDLAFGFINLGNRRKAVEIAGKVFPILGSNTPRYVDARLQCREPIGKSLCLPQASDDGIAVAMMPALLSRKYQ